MNSALNTLKNRGFFQQCTDEAGLSALMDREAVTFYVGCDPTGSSLHIGHMVPFFAFRHLIAAGHKGIALLGGGTARIGDPSGKTEMRQMLTYEKIDENVLKIEKQLDAFIGFDGKKALSDNNKNWLSDLNYIDFLRDIGSCFSVNKMLTFEAYKKRMETGLSFLEFNYQLLQSFDFLKLHERHNCLLQIGGDDQWGNIVAGVDLIRRKTGAGAFGLTFPLITRSDGKKMGKTEKGALFLDKNLTSVYDFFQYWRNVADNDVKSFLLLFTFLPLDEIDSLLAGDINAAKERLAFEITLLIHGEAEAKTALEAARAAFGGIGNTEAMPKARIELSAEEKERGSLEVTHLFVKAGLVPSVSEARRLIQQGGAHIIEGGTDAAITDIAEKIAVMRIKSGKLILRAGKKKFCRIELG